MVRATWRDEGASNARGMSSKACASASPCIAPASKSQTPLASAIPTAERHETTDVAPDYQCHPAVNAVPLDPRLKPTATQFKQTSEFDTPVARRTRQSLDVTPVPVKFSPGINIISLVQESQLAGKPISRDYRCHVSDQDPKATKSAQRRSRVQTA